MVPHIPIMITAMILAVIVMLIFADAVSGFINRHPSMKVLALSFLLLIGVLLVADCVRPTHQQGLRLFRDGLLICRRDDQYAGTQTFPSPERLTQKNMKKLFGLTFLFSLSILSASLFGASPAMAQRLGNGAGAFGAPGSIVITGELEGHLHNGWQLHLQPSADYFIATNVSIGGLIGFTHNSGPSVVGLLQPRRARRLQPGDQRSGQLLAEGRHQRRPCVRHRRQHVDPAG